METTTPTNPPDLIDGHLEERITHTVFESESPPLVNYYKGEIHINDN